MNLGLLCSGGLGTKILIELYNQHKVNFVFTDSKSREIISFCSDNKLPIFIGNPRNGKAIDFISKNSCDILISINYLFVVDKDVIYLGSKLSFNIHGSLLPKYRGRTPHVWSIINGEELTGITAHIIDEGCDTGEILEQIKIPIDQKDTGNDILLKYADNYLPLIQKVITKLTNGKLKSKHQDSIFSTYFGKRVPEDGLIDWNWHKERIYNWVRAQAHPYPGAFTFNNGEKVTIDKISYSNHGYEYDLVNGTILKVNPLIVKTPNGAIEIKKIREKIELTKGKILG
jgi:methionyl-tRNA formyltransferase